MRRFLPVVWLLVPSSLLAQDRDYVPAHYTKQEAQIPMRDGKRLFTSIYLPKDASKPYPILFTRTPYSVSPYGPEKMKTTLGPSALFLKEGFIFVYQDVRGRYMSEGEFVNVRPYRPGKSASEEVDESSDTYDSIEWLVKNVPNHNGRVGMWGISYPGFYTAMGMIDAHPALKAASPQAPVSDWFVGDDFHHNGALYLAHAYRFLDRFGHPRPKPTVPVPQPQQRLRDGYSYFLEMGPLSNANDERHLKGDVTFWTEMMSHPNYDEYWKARNLRPHLKGIKPAVMTVGGWFDAEDLFGALKVYEAVETQSPGASNIIVMGPWYHGQWAGGDGDVLGPVRFGSKTSLFYREHMEFAFFMHHLKGRDDPKLPEAYMFETGSNKWREFDAWPPKNVKPRMVYFHSSGRLSLEAPKDDGAFDEYVSDPAKPVPYIAGQATGMTREHMVDDQRFAASRPDVLVYQTEPLSEEMTIAGPIEPRLHVSTTGTDSDWVVKLIDVFPEDEPDPEPNPARIRMVGYQMLLRGECFRGRFRKGFENPQPFTPGKAERIEYVMPDVLHTFRRGHRIMVQVQSSWFPLVDRNPQTFVDIYGAKEQDFQKATERVYRSKDAPSGVLVHQLN